jgi:hypothetical protein
VSERPLPVVFEGAENTKHNYKETLPVPLHQDHDSDGTILKGWHVGSRCDSGRDAVLDPVTFKFMRRHSAPISHPIRPGLP